MKTLRKKIKFLTYDKPVKMKIAEELEVTLNAVRKALRLFDEGKGINTKYLLAIEKITGEIIFKR